MVDDWISLWTRFESLSKRSNVLCELLCAIRMVSSKKINRQNIVENALKLFDFIVVLVDLSLVDLSLVIVFICR